MKLNHTTFIRLGTFIGVTAAIAGLTLAPTSALTSRNGAVATAKSNDSNTAASQAKLKLVITRGTNEINRRLTTLNTLSGKINSTTNLSAGDKSTLSNKVNTEISNLTALKAKLSAETTLSAAQADAQSIFTEYRVYALVVPKVYLVKTADAQQVAESKLTNLAGKLQTRITAAKNDGKKVTALQHSLDHLNSKVSAAQGISSHIESTVINLQPSDYNTNRSVLSGDRHQLKTAQNDIQAATADAKNIVNGLKHL